MVTNQFLATYPFFEQLSAKSRRQVATGVRALTVARGECLLRKGDLISGLHLVASGRLRVFTLSASGAKASLYVLESGESCPLAMNSLLHALPHPAWVESETKTSKLLFMPNALFRILYETETAMRDFVLQTLAKKISMLTETLAERSVNSLDKQLNQFLTQRANDRGEIEITHQEIAVALGTAREVVSRKLERLRSAKLIKSQRGRIVILNPRGLI